MMLIGDEPQNYPSYRDIAVDPYPQEPAANTRAFSLEQLIEKES